MAATADSSPDSSLDSTYLYSQMDAYPWDDDQEFQGGLNAILGSVQDPTQVEHLTTRAKCYYYARKTGTSVDFDGYKRWAEGNREDSTATKTSEDLQQDRPSESYTQDQSHEQEASGGMADAPKPASFADICDMIAEGKPIPGIKDIPDTVLEGQKSETQKEQRRKPWEKSTAGLEKPSWMG